MRPVALLLLGPLAAAPLAAQTDSALIRHALRLHRAVPMIDGHNDLPWKLRTRGSDSSDSTAISRANYSWDSLDISRPQPKLDTDIPRLRAGGVGGIFLSTWVPVELMGGGAARTELEQIDIVRRLPERYPATFALALTADDVLRIHRQGKIALLIGMEGGHVIENSLPLLRMYYDLGARYMTLTHFGTLAWADAAGDSTHHGLTPFGRAVVLEMNRLGMLVDLAHVSDSVMAQVLRISRAPVIFSHSSARALADVPRDVPDDILRMLPGNGGVVMVNFYCPFVDSAWVRHGDRQRAAVQDVQRRYGADTAAARAAAREWRAANPPPPRPSIAMVADHLQHIRAVAGIDHIGYGSDFDGMDCAPAGLEDASKFPALTAELLRRGWSDGDVEKVIGLNVLRVLREAQLVATRLQRTERPAVATIYSLDSLPPSPPPPPR
jgi:membrane dipeptidase